MTNNITNYINRYGDEITFTQINDKEIIMSGGKYIRFGTSNDYMPAYTTYLREVDSKISLEEFINMLYVYDETTYKYKYPDLDKYRTMVKPTNDINMVDPSGGPYLTAGMDMRGFGLSGIIRWFEFIEDSKIKIYVS